MRDWHACIALSRACALMHAGSQLQVKEAEVSQVVPSVVKVTAALQAGSLAQP